jgi:autotransporter translocation and assembly factor TamB
LGNIALDLDVQMKKRWVIDTNLIKVEGQPIDSLKIRGSLLEPIPLGEIKIVPGGRVTNLLPAGDIVLEEGSTIAFLNPTVLAPSMDLKGRVDVSPYVVNLNITGTLDAWDIKMNSTPSLRQDDIFAILIDPSQSTTIGSSSGPVSQAALNSGLAAAGSGLVQTLALAQFQDSLRRSLGLDRVSVVWRAGTTGNSEADITVGKNLNLSGLRVPLVYSHRKVGDVITQSGQVEWRFGNFVLQLGVSQSGSDQAGVAGEIRHTWVPRW